MDEALSKDEYQAKKATQGEYVDFNFEEFITMCLDKRKTEDGRNIDPVAFMMCIATNTVAIVPLPNMNSEEVKDEVRDVLHHYMAESKSDVCVLVCDIWMHTTPKSEALAAWGWGAKFPHQVATIQYTRDEQDRRVYGVTEWAEGGYNRFMVATQGD